MKFQSSFDIYEILAYILPGSVSLFALLLALNVLSPESLIAVNSLIESQNAIYTTVVLVGLSAIIGQANSQIVRDFVRKLHWSSKNSSEMSVKESGSCPDKSLLYVDFHQTIEIRIVDRIDEIFREAGIIFDKNTCERPLNKHFQKLLNDYAYEMRLCDNIDYIRDTRNRSFIGNSIFPVLALTLALLINEFLLISIFSACLAGFLFKRQGDLDKRVWREIYSSLLVIKPEQKQTSLISD